MGSTTIPEMDNFLIKLRTHVISQAGGRGSAKTDLVSNLDYLLATEDAYDLEKTQGAWEAVLGLGLANGYLKAYRGNPEFKATLNQLLKELRF